jgi:osmotically-inducible protein OsmY
MNMRIPAILAASLALSAFGAANTTDAVKQTSQGSKGDFTASNEGKSTMPVPPTTVATAEKATGADKSLVDSITKSLNDDTSLKGSKIKVMASNGNVTLSGSVKDKSQSAKAESDAKGLAKSAKVTNNLSATG